MSGNGRTASTTPGAAGTRVAAAPRLTAVIGEAPAAVLLVDLADRQVVFANPVAEQLAPATALPLALDAWAEAAQLRDADGVPLADGTHPLSELSREVGGQAISAARRSEMGRRREPLWVVSLPMTGAPMLDDHALVVFLPMREVEAREAMSSVAAAAATHDDLDVLEALGRSDADGDEGALLRDRAVVATGLSFTVADAQAPDQPLVWVNPAFTVATGYAFDEVVGTNCRFLQGAETDRDETARIRAALTRGEAVTSTLINYRKDGLLFWNQVDISPIHDAQGRLTHFVGIQSDVTGRVDADLARDRALLAEREARAEAELAQGRLRFLADAVDRLSGSLDVTECRRQLLDLVVPRLGDWALLFRVDDRGGVVNVESAHVDDEQTAALERLGRALPLGIRRGTIQELFLQGRDVRRINDLDQSSSHAERRSYLDDMTLVEQTHRLGSRSAMYVAVPGREQLNDLLIVVRGPERPQFDDQDLAVGLDLGRRAGLILDNARLYEAQTLIADTLQRSLLPSLPVLPGVESAARYVAGTEGAKVGGDFYELFELPDASLGLVVGDVMGHDVNAAAVMGHLTGLLRAAAYDVSATPAAVLAKVDQLITGFGMPTIASAAHARLVRGPGGWTMTWANAGHPPLVVRFPDGRVDVLLPPSGRHDLLLGVEPHDRLEHELALPAGTTVIGYTDGLVERRGEDLDDGLRRLRDAVAAGPQDVHALCDHLLVDVGHSPDDDAAILAVRLLD